MCISSFWRESLGLLNESPSPNKFLVTRHQNSNNASLLLIFFVVDGALARVRSSLRKSDTRDASVILSFCLAELPKKEKLDHQSRTIANSFVDLLTLIRKSVIQFYFFFLSGAAAFSSFKDYRRWRRRVRMWGPEKWDDDSIRLHWQSKLAGSVGRFFASYRQWRQWQWWLSAFG